MGSNTKNHHNLIYDPSEKTRGKEEQIELFGHVKNKQDFFFLPRLKKILFFHHMVLQAIAVAYLLSQASIDPA